MLFRSCLEIRDRRLTGQKFHRYLNPEREIDAGALEVHGISRSQLSDAPRFADVVVDFIEFVRGAELIIHNAPFDVGFLRAAAASMGYRWPGFRVADTVKLARRAVTRDEVPNPQNLAMWLDLNGERMQNGSTKTMIFGVAKLVSYVSQFMTLEPGDVITTGTPPGVGLGIKKNGKPAPVFLKAGDVMTVGIEGLGVQTQRVVAYRKG